MSNSYGADSIKVLKGLEAVRKRPGMYIGDTDDGSGLHHMIFEVTDNSVDEALAGYCSTITITLCEDGSVSVEDDGRGIPVEMHKEQGVSAAEVIMTQLHAGGKFDQDSYKVSGGLHGVGVSVVNALSSELELRVWRDLKEHKILFRDGVAVSKLEVVGSAEKRGTYVKFRPSTEIFTHVIFELSILEKRFRELAFLNKGIKFILRDYRGGATKETTFFSEGGLNEFVSYLNRSKSPLHKDVISFAATDKLIQVEGSLQWTDSYHENVLCFTNNIPQADGGTHLSGFRSALTRLVGKVLEEKLSEAKKKTKAALQGEDIREGLTGIISVKLPDPKFSAQTKSKLVSSEVRPVVEGVVVDSLERAFNEDPALVKGVLDKVLQAAAAREAAKRARELTRKKTVIDSTLSGKLADCQSKKPEEKELYIVEGDSAGSTAKEGRDRKYQAILPIKGKIMNVERARFDRVLGSAEVGSLVVALGTGIGVEDFNIEKIRYHKVVLMTDADVDGCHIRTLLLTFFYRHMPAIIENGYLYVAQPPLYRISKGKQEWYLKNDEAFDRFVLDRSSEYTIEQNEQEVDVDVRLLLKLSMDWRNALVGAGVFLDGGSYGQAVVSGVPHALEMNEEGEFSLNDQVREAFCKRLQASDPLIKRVDADSDGLVVVYNVYGSEMEQKLQYSDLWKLRVPMDKYEPLLGLLRKGETRIIIAQKPYAFNTIDGLFHSVNLAIKSTMQVQRYKGLGEMNPDQLWNTTLNPENRTLLQVQAGGSPEETDEVFSRLMGDVVEPRRRFIQENALLVKSLDV